jgi:signal transduction histidine kinase
VAELRQGTLRVALGLAVVLLGFVDINTLLQSVRSQERLRRRVARAVSGTVERARPRITATLQRGTRRQAVEVALRLTGAAEAELFRRSGERHVAWPRRAPVSHWPSPEELDGLGDDGLLCIGPVMGSDPRLLTYALLREADGERVVLRLATRVPDLIEDLRERKMLWIGHGLALLVLLVAAALAVFSTRHPDPGSPPGALEAYEEAMERLRDHGLAQGREHEIERRRMAEEIELKEAMGRAGELAAGMAHEVRNGLATIVGYARLVERGAEPSEAAAAVRAILEECGALEATVRRLMDYVSSQRLELQAFDLERLLSRVAAREARHGPAAEVSTRVAAGGSVVADEALLERALENLVRNALEAAGDGGHVWLEAEREGSLARVRISDDGPGLPADVRRGPRPFRSTKPGGLGLGLPMALKIVRLHGGEVRFRDRSPRGLEVEVRLPAEGPEAAPGVTLGSAPTPEGTPQPPAGSG